MKINYTLCSVVCLLLSVPLAVYVLQRGAGAVPAVRFATYNIACNRPAAGQLLAELRGGKDDTARRLAEVVQRNEVDVLLLCELDWDAAGAALATFADEYLAVAQNGQKPISFPYRYVAPVNTGEPSGLDLDGDGKVGGPGDAYGFGQFPGQYGMALLSRYPILEDRVRTFRDVRWSAMPGALRPEGLTDEVWNALRLSSKSHWDVPIGIGPVDGGMVVHVLASHPTPPVFDGPEDRNGCRNHDEIRFWVDYTTPGEDGWIVDDAGVAGGLAADARFVVMGDLNCDPADGDGRRDGLNRLLQLPQLQDPAPSSAGGVEQSQKQWGVNAGHQGDPARDTGDFPDQPGSGPGGGPGNLRLDFVLPSRQLRVLGSGVFWPPAYEPAAALVTASDHRLVWVDVAASR
ncbi:MAG: endonuclease/exonuclease/phosphatase family protein [Planctomycetes bacterium]|nr:endonuclease/exonuclease/phosphatase family protein [Planctomycetota bacterium]